MVLMTFWGAFVSALSYLLILRMQAFHNFSFQQFLFADYFNLFCLCSTKCSDDFFLIKAEVNLIDLIASLSISSFYLPTNQINLRMLEAPRTCVYVLKFSQIHN